jgi:hypothetical protein
MRQKQAAVIFITVGIVALTSCSKKHVPERTAEPRANTAAPAVKKVPVKKVPAVPVAKVILVNDSVAKKNIDGRLYYDVGGHRYWRNYDDGKYYLFNKSMYTDKAFKPH